MNSESRAGPIRHVGAEGQADDDEPFEGKMKRLVVELRAQHVEGAKSKNVIGANLKDLGYGV